MTNIKEEEEEDECKFRSILWHLKKKNLLISSFPFLEKGIPLFIPTRQNSSSIITVNGCATSMQNSTFNQTDLMFSYALIECRLRDAASA